MLLHELARHWIHYAVVLVVAHAISTINAYLGYKYIVFRKMGATTFAEFGKFSATYVVMLVINLAALPVLVEVLGITVPVAQAVIVIATVIFGYFAHRHFSFAR